MTPFAVFKFVIYRSSKSEYDDGQVQWPRGQVQHQEPSPARERGDPSPHHQLVSIVGQRDRDPDGQVLSDYHKISFSRLKVMAAVPTTQTTRYLVGITKLTFLLLDSTR